MSENRVILVVDDVDQVGSVTSEYIMRRISHTEAYETTSPHEALEWLRTAPRVDLILSDNRMGEMDGVTFLAEAARLQPAAVRALMTAYLELGVSHEELARRGIHALVKKPWQWTDFTVFVVELLAMASSPGARARSARPLQFPEHAFDEAVGADADATSGTA